jgi:hypothetical protein
MTTGALMFAFNNEGTDYLRIAAWNASNIHRWLDIPVAVVTDELDVPTVFDRVIRREKQVRDTRYFGDLDRSVSWYNAGRPEAWDLTPWDRTLLLDVDYVVNSRELQPVLESSQELLAFDQAFDVTGTTDFGGLNCFGEYQMPMTWATVVVFDRTVYCQQVFDCMKMIRSNWNHYRDLYGINNRTYRNDHALSIALSIVNGHAPVSCAIPWSMATVMPSHRLSLDSQQKWRVDYVNSQSQSRHCGWHNKDFHAMGKQDLENIVASH